jgi:UDP-MurNAc hydroxylase
MRELRPEQKGYEFLPGTVVELNHGEISVSQSLYSDAEIEHIFGDKWTYLAEQRDSRQDEIAAEEASRAAVLPPDEMLAALKEWWEPLLRRGRIFRDGVGGNVRFRIGELDMVVDFPKAKVREYAGEECIYWYTIPGRPRLDEHRRPRDRLVELDLPVDAVRGRAQRQVQRVPHDVPQVPVP